MLAEKAGKSIHICKMDGKKSSVVDQMSMNVANVYVKLETALCYKQLNEVVLGTPSSRIQCN